MAYRLKFREDLDVGLHRILIEQCERAESQLAAGSDPRTAVHEARKGLKRMRALLRLVRDGIGDERWQAANGTLRDIARGLSPLRDRDVARQTLQQLAVAAPRPLAKALATLATRIEADTGDGRASEATQPALTAAAHNLAAFRAGCVELRVDDRASEAIRQGLRRSQARGRAMVAACGDVPGNEALHDLRKAVQVHWRQMTLLSNAWPALMKARAAEARTISMLLGEDQDLAMIERQLADAPHHGLTRTATDHIARACRSRRRAIQSEAMVRANRLFLEKPARFAAQISAAWVLAGDLNPKRTAPAAAELA